MAFSEACHQGFSLGTPVSSHPSSVNGSVSKMKLNIIIILLMQRPGGGYQYIANG